ncbi:MAG: DNA recombination protein RmuC [Acidimicrobiales bacterium]
MIIVTVLAVLAAVLVAAAVAAFVLMNRSHRRSLEDVQEANRAALASIAADRDAVLAALDARHDFTVTAAGSAAADKALELAGATLDDRLKSTGREMELRHTGFESRVGEISAALEKVGTAVSQLQRERASQHGELVEKLKGAAEITSALSLTTASLRDALAHPKTRGQWGERMADDVLRSAGFVEGVSYRRQTAGAAGTVPDFTFLMPKGRELNMDVKFPVDNYLRHLDATDDAEAEQFAKAFTRDVRNRVKEITTRDYIDPERTVDYVVLFIPNEAVYTFLHERDSALVDWAISQKVVLCSPFTLFAVLAVVRQAIDSFAVSETSGEILDCLGRFSKEWRKFSDHIDKVEKQLGTVTSSFESLSGTRRRMLERELARIDDLRTERGLVDDPDETLVARPTLREVAGG